MLVFVSLPSSCRSKIGGEGAVRASSRAREREENKNYSIRGAPASGRTSFAPPHIALDRGHGRQY